MTDMAVEMLISAINNEQGASLWFVDEATSANDVSQVNPRESLQVITNRYDAWRGLQGAGFNAQCSDFSVEDIQAHSLQAVFFRVGKEKAQVHYWINCAAHILAPGGRLFLSGGKHDGIKTYIEKAAQLLGSAAEKQRANGSKGAVQIASIVTTSAIGDALDDKHYRQRQDIQAAPVSAAPGMDSSSATTVTLLSKPGIFGWQKIDQGSYLLAQCFANLLHGNLARPARILDLGCGYGYLSVQAHLLTGAEIVATDNNVTAVETCRANFSRHTLSGNVVLADCADVVDQPVDVVLCNPPFHQGFAVESELTGRFLQATRRLLTPGGTALFVVNSFIPLERAAEGRFLTVTTVANNRQFKVIQLRR